MHISAPASRPTTSWSRRPRRPASSGSSRSAWTSAATARRSPRRGPSTASSPPSAATRTPPPASTTTPPPTCASSPPTRSSAPSARPVSTTTATTRRAATSCAPSRRRSRSPAAPALPLVIHVRDAAGPGSGQAVSDCFELLAAEAEGVDVILHCFSAGPERAAEAVERGWYVLLRRQRHLPVGGDPARGGGAGARRPAPGRDRQPRTSRRSRCAASRTRPPTSCSTAAVVAEARGADPAEQEAAIEANAARLFGW